MRDLNIVNDKMNTPTVISIGSSKLIEMVDPNTTFTIKKKVKKRNHQRQDEQARIVNGQLTPELK